ncbi:DUF4240 domain-containing protein [Micromonospora sp. WMMD1120]|uniref:DUF4240 domain-containing protein n=1 Tax=Micromonospora sp. WMMD1120 TaxID=3016106 RepID=UPI002416B7F2|nr:DUF4240 domain-containing protein [Micromonospora sp. WMMD1120]MDG4809363.1 DUF4240 domain-containing protein [Micromonospora sp. WMMD1120]
MRVDEFWSLIERAREDVPDDAGAWPSGSMIGAALAARLAQLPAERIVEFQRCYERVAARGHRWGLCAAAYVIWGYVSDDAFSDFTAGLIGLGRDAFERAVTDADSLAEHPMVQAIAAGHVDRFALAAEAIEFAAPTAFGQHSDDADGFWEASEAQPDGSGDRDEPSAEHQWSGRFGSADDAAQIPLRLPRLLALYPDRVPGDH